MVVIPSIDLKDGVCVRLRKGAFNTVHRVAEDPIETATAFEDSGAEIIHIVDLDGALKGEGKNQDIVKAIAKGTNTLKQLGGGLRDMESLNIVDCMGIDRMVIGSAATTNPEFVADAVDKYGDRIVVGIDAKNGVVRTSGWTKSSGMNYLDFALKIAQIGVKYIVFTDIDRDGMLTGPSVESLKLINEAVKSDIVASGGVSSLDDLLVLKEMGMYGAIVGKAIYTGAVRLEEAIEKCR